jgi:voltage-gated potassium channel
LSSRFAARLAPRDWRFLQLTLWIVAWMFALPYLRDRWLAQILLQLFFLNCLAVTLWANPSWRQLRAAAIALWVLSLLGSLLTLLPLAPTPGWQRVWRIVDVATNLPLLAVLVAGVLRYAFNERRLSVDGIFATVAAYLLVAVLFAQTYMLATELDPACFNLAADLSSQARFGSLLYFSFVTLATLGYGDVLPLHDTVRTLAVIEAVVGQFYVAVIVAVFIGLFVSGRKP